MPSPLIRKLENFEKLSKTEKQAILAVSTMVRAIGRGKIILREGDEPRKAVLIVKGLACRYKLLPDGGRQITDILVPGDLCDGRLPLVHEMDHSVGTLSACDVADIDRKMLLAIAQKHPRITRALSWTSLAGEATLREWVANVGRRPADKRVAFLLCELIARINAIQRARTGGLQLPLGQIDLADAAALSIVHTNRILHRLREKKLVAVERRSITVADAEGLMEFAEFDPSYLYPNRKGART